MRYFDGGSQPEADAGGAPLHDRAASRRQRAQDSVIAAVHRAQADALEIEAQAKRRLADEYDAAQDRGEIRSNGERSFSAPEKVSGADVVQPKVLHEARQVRDADAAAPGIVRRTLDARLNTGQEPTRAALREAVPAAAIRPDLDVLA